MHVGWWGREKGGLRLPLRSRLTGAVSKLEAQVGAPEPVDGNGQLDHLAPAGAVVVVQDEGTVLAAVGLPAAQTDAVLQRQGQGTLAKWNMRTAATARLRPR